MKILLVTMLLLAALIPLYGKADCLSARELQANGQFVLFGQTSFTHKSESIWKIDGTNPYTNDNQYYDIALNLSSSCAFITDVLDVDFSLYGLGYYSLRDPGLFEKDDHRSKLLIDRLRLMWSLSESISFEGGKLNPPLGTFHLRSPATLLTTYYAGFKPTRVYDLTLKPVYSESFWGGRISAESRDYAFSLTVAPKLASIHEYYESSSNWSENERSNSSERYLLSYSDYRLNDHRLTASLMLGDSPSLALADGYNLTPQFILNSEVALHTAQQWRHFSKNKRDAVFSGLYPSSLYVQEDKNGVELALGGQYTTDLFSVLGIEYYFQSEGYSKSAWKEQTDFIKLISKKTGSSTLNKVFDDYKYLMGSEISNTSNKGLLQGKHYINSWVSFQNDDNSTIQPYFVMNLVDGSALFGTHISKPLKGLDDHAEIYTGLYSAIGDSDSEFALFGETLGIYFGFKYYL